MSTHDPASASLPATPAPQARSAYHPDVLREQMAVLRREAGTRSKAERTIADEFIAQAETRAEKLGSSLGVMAAVFYFMPFVITVLVVVGVPLIQTITGQ